MLLVLLPLGLLLTSKRSSPSRKEGERMKRRITRLVVWLLTVVLLVSCTGCMDSVQLKSRTIIKMVGIDREEEQYLLTLLYFAPQAQAGEKTSSTSMQVIQTRGDSISQAFDRVKITAAIGCF